MEITYTVKSAKHLSLGSLVKLGFYVNVYLWLSIGIILGIASLFGADTIKFNNTYSHGVGGLFSSLLFAVMFTIGGTVTFTTGAILMKFLSKWLPVPTLEVPAEESSD